MSREVIALRKQTQLIIQGSQFSADPRKSVDFAFPAVPWSIAAVGPWSVMDFAFPAVPWSVAAVGPRSGFFFRHKSYTRSHPASP